MIQWIALGLAADAEVRAGAANRKAKRALHESRRSLEDAMVTVRPVDLVRVKIRKTKGFWDDLFCLEKKVLDKEPWAELSLKRSDILHISSHKDGDGRPFCYLSISEYARIKRNDSTVIGIYVPGSLSKITAVLNGVKRRKK